MPRSRPLSDAEQFTPCVDPATRDRLKKEALCAATAASVKMFGQPAIFPKIIDRPAWNASKAGHYRTKTHVVELNLKILCDEEQYKDTLYHELAHAVHQDGLKRAFARGKMYAMADLRSHSAMWQRILLAMGRAPKRCHDIDLNKYMPEKYAGATCVCGYKHSMTRTRLKKVAAAGRRFTCRCGRPLEPAAFKEVG
jgi:hypothetical protein